MVIYNFIASPQHVLYVVENRRQPLALAGPQAPVVREGIGVDLRAIEIEYRRLWLSLLTSRTHSTSNGYCSAASLEDCCGVLHAKLGI
jgi:hypothetical protein